MDRFWPHARCLQKLARLARMGGGVALWHFAANDRQTRIAEDLENLAFALGIRGASVGNDGGLLRLARTLALPLRLARTLALPWVTKAIRPLLTLTA